MPAFPAMCNALLHLIHIILLSLHWVVHCTIMCYGDRGPLTDTSITLHCSLTLIALPCIEGKWMVLEGGCFLGLQHFALQCFSDPVICAHVSCSDVPTKLYCIALHCVIEGGGLVVILSSGHKHADLFPCLPGGE